MSATTQLQQSEKQFQTAVIDLARRYRWLVAHFHDSRREITDRRTGGRRLIGDADAKGFPDLVLCRAPELLIVELKGMKGKIRPDQRVWLETLGTTATAISYAVGVAKETDESELPGFLRVDEAARFEVHTWRPDDWSQIERRLK